MPNIGYNPGEPLANETPSVSQPKMAQNTNAVNDIIAVDHYSFGVDNGGYHKQINFPGPVAQADPTPPRAILYPVSGVASNSQTDLVWRNQATFPDPPLLFPVTMIRAFGTVQNGVMTNAYNAAFVSQTSGTITINLTSGCVTGTNYIVLCSTTTGTTGGGAKDQICTTYSIESDTQIKFKSVDVRLGPTGSVTDVLQLSFIVMQA